MDDIDRGLPTPEEERSPENIERFIEQVEELQASPVEPAPQISWKIPEEKFEISEVPHKGAFALKNRLRTMNRLKYETEVEVIKRQIGDLEQIRSKLNLSRRKMCQLLMVDPSAWSRWTKEGAPPHVYRALEWYMLLTKEAPAQAHSYWINTVGGRTKSEDDGGQMRRLRSETLLLDERMRSFATEINQLKEGILKQQIRQNRILLFGLLIFTGTIAAGAAIAFRFFL